MLFKKDVEPSCLYCRYGRPLGQNEVGCLKLGVVSANGKCKRFSYDPLSRKPMKPLVLKTDVFDEESFKL
ncbi:MAG: hypothetical protein IJL71_05070 [Oscillospiraceae bacterium]|nr:hypothetical protein [Oscillospiraceae bacterium]